MVKHNDDETKRAKPEERLKLILFPQHISHIFCKDKYQLSRQKVRPAFGPAHK